MNLCDLEDGGHRACQRADLDTLGYEVRGAEHECFTILKDGRFLSAQTDGRGDHVANCGGWEKFREVSDDARPEIPLIPESQSIPKRIHQTDNPLEIGAQFADNVDQLKTLNDGWVYEYYSEKDRLDYIYEFYGWPILKDYLSINPRFGAARADLFRYLCIYRHGGVYFDMKSGVERPLDEIIREGDRFLLSHWASARSTRFHGWGRGCEVAHVEGGEYVQWFIICTAGHPLMRKVVEQVLFNIRHYLHPLHGSGSTATLNITGPHVFTRAICGHVAEGTTRLLDAENEGLVYNNIANYMRSSNYRGEQSPLIL
ncbi:glycosyltransferase [Asaia sp. BMEF1]|uniref:glycosyltransferase family 32 protein n=1 Tax=unclassified Asaia TaxID=2685023 RepID=UPI00301653BF